MSSSWMRSSSWISASFSTISVRRLSAYLRLDLFELHHDDVVEELRAGQDGAEARDRIAELRVVLRELLVLQARQPRQAHLEDGLGLTLGERVGVLSLGLLDLVLRAPRAAHERLEPGERERHQRQARRLRIRGLADRLHDEVDVRHRDAQALDDLSLGLGLVELEARAARDHVAPVGDEGLERLLEVEDRRTPLRDGEVDDAEASSADRSAGRAG